jgi:hypothetical protein
MLYASPTSSSLNRKKLRRSRGESDRLVAAVVGASQWFRCVGSHASETFYFPSVENCTRKLRKRSAN